jgi:arylsulfotransferase ASST
MKRSRLVVLVPVLALVAGGVTAAVVLATGSGPAEAHAYPEPGSIAASPGTSITVRGVAADKVGKIAATGSKTGKHVGAVTLSRDGDGATFTPKSPFAEGETVTVHTKAAIAGAKHGAFSFTIAHHAKPAAAQDAAAAPTSGPYLTRPDMDPPAVTVSTTGTPFNGLIASAPNEGATGVLLSDGNGQPVWFKPTDPGHVVGDLHVATYRGKKVLVYFEGTEGFGQGNYRGSWHVLNSSYEEVAKISAGNGASADLHDILLRSDGTAVVESYDPVVMNMTKYGGKARATVLDCDIQQVDIATGDVLFEWHSLDHIPPSDSYADLTGSIVDYFHANSLGADPHHPNNVIVSSRHLSQVFALNLKTGKIAWRLGGKHPTLKLTKGAADTVAAGGRNLPFSYQHDARLHPDGTLTLYDNGNQRKPGFSRAATFTLNLKNHTATEKNSAEIRHDPDLYGDATGDVQQLPGGDTLVSWGTTGKATEYDAGKNVVAEIDTSMTYRLFKVSWRGTPGTRPSVVNSMTADGHDNVHVSWNGATQVADWRILAGTSARTLHAITTTKRNGFETTAAIPVDTTTKYVQVQALDGAGKVLGTSIAAQVVQP